MARRLFDFVSPFELCIEKLPAESSGLVRWDEVYGTRRPLRIEVGVGNSFFLIEIALRSPEFSYLGFEYSRKRVLKFLKKVQAAGLSNIRILALNALSFLDRAFAPDSVDHLYINHPDPWPKRRHAKKRLIQPQNVQKMLRLLRPGGGMSLRTDVRAYAIQMLEVLEGTEGLRNSAGRGAFSPEPLEPYRTAFEEKFVAQGRPIYYLEYRKQAAEGEAPAGSCGSDDT